MQGNKISNMENIEKLADCPYLIKLALHGNPIESSKVENFYRKIFFSYFFFWKIILIINLKIKFPTSTYFIFKLNHNSFHPLLLQIPPILSILHIRVHPWIHLPPYPQNYRPWIISLLPGLKNFDMSPVTRRDLYSALEFFPNQKIRDRIDALRHVC